MNFSAAFYTAADAPVQLPAGVTVRPQRWAAHARGGCDDAEIEIDGPREALYTLLSWIGFQAHISNADGRKVWWGDVEEVEIVVGGVALGVNLRNFANRIQIRYTARRVGGASESAETGWQQNDASVTQFGVFERRINAAREMNEAEASTYQATALSYLSVPAKSLRPGQGAEQASATLRCTGYWQRLRRSYYRNLSGLIEHTASGKAQPIGLSFVTQWTAFTAGDSGSMVHDLYGRFARCSYAGAQFVVSGASNYGPWTVQSTETKDPVAYVSNQITFDPADDIENVAGGLGFIAVDDVILVSGSAQAANNRLYRVKTAGGTRIEISPGWSGGNIVASASGPTVTIRRGNAIKTVETVSNERPTTAANRTVIFWGYAVYQTFVVPETSTFSSWTVDGVELRCRRVGSPTDSLRVRLFTVADGAPQTLLDTAQVAGSDLGDVMDWVRFAFSNTATISKGNTYALVIDRTVDAAAGDFENFYEIDADEEAGYSGGVYRVSDRSAWQTPATAKSLIFRLTDAMDNARQIERIWSLAGVGLGALSVESDSAIATSQYRTGDLTSLDEIEELMERGTDANRRLLAWVSPERNGRLFQEPNSSTADLVYGEDRKLRTAQGNDVDDGFLPAGQWVHIPIGHELPGAWASLSPMLVDRAEYRVGQGLIVEPFGQRNDFSIGLRAG